MNFLQQIGRKLQRPVFSGYNGRGGWGWMSRFPGGGSFDYKAEAGPLWESSIPFACIKWEQRATVEADLCIQAKDANGDWKEQPDHPALKLLADPNPFFDMHQLLDAVRFDYHLSGNAYVYKARSGMGRVVQLWWMPSWLVEPRWQEDGSAFIDCYEYLVNGVSYALPVEDVIHFRNGVDPRSFGRKGLSDFAAVLREVCTDNEASIFVPTLLRNMGVPGVIVSPKSIGEELTREQRRQFIEIWNESFTGERRGEPFVQSVPLDITSPGLSPQEMVLDKLRAVPEQRICGSFGIPASVLQLGTGLENSNTRAGKSDDRAQAYESCVIPTLFTLARTLTRALLSEYGGIGRTRVWFDLSNVTCLQPNLVELFTALSNAYNAGWLMRSEVRTKAGYKSTPEDDVYAPKSAAPGANNAGDPASADTAGSGEGSSSDADTADGNAADGNDNSTE